MTTKLNDRKAHRFNIKRVVPYVFATAVIFATAIFGSMNKTETNNGTSVMLAINSDNYAVSVDQISELYLVAEVAQNVNFESSSYLSMDYASAVTQYSINLTATDKLTKPSYIDTSSLSSGGVISYTVQEGDSMDSIAAQYKITTDQIRWSNGLKTTDLSVGQNLLLPGTPGIVYIVKSGETIDGIASKYGTSVELIMAWNNLGENATLADGNIIVLPDGVLPETERPEYVAPVVVTHNSNYYNFSYTSANPMPYGWCTWYAWQWRYENMPENYRLPGGTLGNARYWDNNLSGAFFVDSSPQYGDVFVNESGYYGHVGIVTSVNDDGTITISDMNGVAGWGSVGSRISEYSEWSNWSFIHQRR